MSKRGNELEGCLTREGTGPPVYIPREEYFAAGIVEELRVPCFSSMMGAIHVTQLVHSVTSRTTLANEPSKNHYVTHPVQTLDVGPQGGLPE
jgi:hypothetical protein